MVCSFSPIISGGKVRSADKREYGPAQVSIVPGPSENPLFAGLPPSLDVWMSHGDEALDLPPGFSLTARTANAVAGMADPARNIWAVQFHPEVRHTPRGTELLRNFLFRICHAEPNWTPAQFIQSTVSAIREQVGDGRAICALSGGVDSSVAAVLVERAIGDRLTCVFVNNGVLRKNEFLQVQQNMRDRAGLAAGSRGRKRPFSVPAGRRRSTRSKSARSSATNSSPSSMMKRCAFSSNSSRAPAVAWLVQGTLYPDVIESSSVKGPSQTIKSHHNVGGLPANMKLKLIEPLRDLFKDEVRRIGRDLGMPAEILERQPFPGPGLAVRILGEVTPERVALLQEADDIVVKEIKAAGLYQQIWQSFAVLLPVKSVGVMGDQRTYAYTCAIRAVHSEDGMTADWVPLPYDLLKKISSRIVNEIHGINRVVYDITSKPPGTIEWE